MEYDKFGINEDGIKRIEGFYHHRDYGSTTFVKSSFLKEWADKHIGEDVGVVFDIGSFEGGDSLRFSSWYPNAIIYSFEASPFNFNFMNEKLRGLRSNIKTFNNIISDINGERELKQVGYPAIAVGMSPDNPEYLVMGSIFRFTEEKKAHHGLKNMDTVVVQSITCDTFCKEHGITNIDIAHIDVEAAGIEVVSGMVDVLPKMIFIEKERQWAFADKKTDDPEMIALLNSKGYEMKVELGNDFLFVLKNIQS